MTRKLAALLGAVALCLTTVAPSTATVSPRATDTVTPAPVSAPGSPTDESKVPHYFGPYPNWANSPFTLPDVTVTISDPTGHGAGAAAVATVGANGAVTGITITDPGNGYWAANVNISGPGSGAAAIAAVTSTGAVTGITVDTPGSGYTQPAVSISGGNEIFVTVGNPLTDRAYATDFVAPPVVVPAAATETATSGTWDLTAGSASGGTFTLSVDGGPATSALSWNASAAEIEAALLAAGVTATVSGTGPWVVTFTPAPATVVVDGTNLTQPDPLVPVFVIVPTAAPAGILTDFQSWNQADPGLSPVASAGQRFHAYVLRPTGVANEYLVVLDSGQLTVPALGGAASELATHDVVDTAVQAGDVLGFYGSGIPVDIVAGGLDRFSFPAPAAPAEGDTLTFGAGGFPDFSQARTYSFGASVTTFAAPSDATATAYGSVDPDIFLDSAGSGYSMPTVDFDMPDDPNGIQASGHAVCAEADCAPIAPTETVTITGVVVDEPGSGYATAPKVAIRNGTLFDPITPPAGTLFVEAQATATINIQSIVVDTFGSGYVTPPDVTISDLAGAGDGATASATIDTGAVTSITLVDGGSGYITSGGIQKFADGLPGLCYPSAALEPAVPQCPDYQIVPGAKYIPIGVSDPAGPYQATPDVSDTYEIGLVQYRTSFSSSLPSSLVRGYVQLETPANVGVSQHFPLVNEFLGPVPVTNAAATAAAPGSDTYDVTVGDATGGTFTLTVDLATTAAIPWDASASDVQAALLAAGVSGAASGSGSLADPWVVVFTPAPGTVSIDGTGLFMTSQPVRDAGGNQYLAVTPPQYLGPTLIAQKDKAVRIVFRNLLPSGDEGDLFFPVDTTIMGSGMSDMNEPFEPTPVPGGTVVDDVRNPMCTDARSMGEMCFLKNRATLHLHGGNTPWISDGTVHQWITPAGDASNPMTAWPEGVSVEDVPDMNVCDAADDGCQTFYYTNQQSARLMFYHDHAWGITRLNVYAGEAAGYVIQDQTETALVNSGALPGLADTIPLVIQDKTFVPQPEQLAWQDPTWDAARWGGYGNLWYHHVYMPAQNPGDPGGMSGFGRWMYGPWFWPPAGDTKYGPIANPYYNMDPEGPDGTAGNADDWTSPLAVPCSLDDPATWQFQEDPFCEPQLIPGTPNISAGMEQFNDTPIVNGVAYPTLTLEPKSYRLRILSAANDRFFNLQWYVGEADTASMSLNIAGQPIGPTEVALNADEVAAAQTDPVVFPTPDLAESPAGPDWVQFGTEGGFLPAPVVVDGQQVTTWINDATRFDVGNVDQHSLLLAPAERADVVVDFSKFAGQTLILYNDAPAAFPARIPSYDYYTGAPDLRPVGAPTILPGYGPNTRTVMQVRIAPNPPATAFNVTRLRNAFSHKANGSGTFESGQHPIIVGQSAYNSAYGTSFASSGWCNSTTSTIKCDGFARISQQGGDLFTFDTLRMKADGTYPAGYGKVSVRIEPKAIHDETNASAFDEFGRMQANLGLEVVPATPGLQNVVLHPMVFPTTEIIDTTKLPTADVKVTPIANGSDGTQIWKITHNGVDTHPIHFHAYDVQLLNRVTWDNIIIQPDATELGWKDTLRIAPLEDTIVALRPVVPKVPFEVPNSVRLLSPMMVDGAPIALSSVADVLGLGMTAFAPNGDPVDIYNHYINYGAEYVYHCHILSHEEMDMMRPVSLVFPPKTPDTLSTGVVAVQGNSGTLRLTWNDTSLTDTGFLVQRMEGGTTTWVDLGTVLMNLDPAEADPLQTSAYKGLRTFDDTTYRTNRTYDYRVIALNTVGDTWNYADPNLNEIVAGGFPTVTAKAESARIPSPPFAPTQLMAALQPQPNSDGSQVQISITWRDNATTETGFQLERSTDAGVTWVTIATPGAFPGTGTITPPYVDLTVSTGNTYRYRVAAVNAGGMSAYSNAVNVVVPAVPAAPSNLTASPGGGRRVALAWTDNATNETGFTIQRATDDQFTVGLVSTNVGANTQSFTTGNLTSGVSYFFRIRANAGTAVWSAWVNAVPFPYPVP